MIQKAVLTLFILGLLCGQAVAAVSIERDVSVTDAQGGSMQFTTTGQANAAGSDSTTTALFNDFQGVQANRNINGEVVRTRSREGRERETTYSGILEIRRTDEQGQVNTNIIEFESLVVNRSGEGPSLSGLVLFNGETLDAAELSDAQLRLLRRTLRFFRFA